MTILTMTGSPLGRWFDPIGIGLRRRSAAPVITQCDVETRITQRGERFFGIRANRGIFALAVTPAPPRPGFNPGASSFPERPSILLNWIVTSSVPFIRCEIWQKAEAADGCIVEGILEPKCRDDEDGMSELLARVN
jgi:hypothetical protein